VSEQPAERQAAMPRADFLTGAVFVLLGIGVIWASLDMPRFEDRNINPYTIPGLVPGALGAIILGLGAALFGRAALAGGWRVAAIRLPEGPGVRRLLLSLLLCLGYAAGLVGHIPFWLATFLFVSLFVVLFEWPRGEGRRSWRIAVALVHGAAISAVVTWVFQYVFLVRLP
jgi:putative tricarboxylic transport membrane protein